MKSATATVSMNFETTYNKSTDNGNYSGRLLLNFNNNLVNNQISKVYGSRVTDLNGSIGFDLFNGVEDDYGDVIQFSSFKGLVVEGLNDNQSFTIGNNLNSLFSNDLYTINNKQPLIIYKDIPVQGGQSLLYFTSTSPASFRFFVIGD